MGNKSFSNEGYCGRCHLTARKSSFNPGHETALCGVIMFSVSVRRLSGFSFFLPQSNNMHVMMWIGPCNELGTCPGCQPVGDFKRLPQHWLQEEDDGSICCRYIHNVRSISQHNITPTQHTFSPVILLFSSFMGECLLKSGLLAWLVSLSLFLHCMLPVSGQLKGSIFVFGLLPVRTWWFRAD